MNWQGKCVFEEMDGFSGRGGGSEVSECGGFADDLRILVCMRYLPYRRTHHEFEIRIVELHSLIPCIINPAGQYSEQIQRTITVI